ncbi:MAG: methyltransferase domain-containing protein [Nitrospirae bacterium]|nr:methyltransferase domain-containing protein [Nitrospirota bacterium]
MYVKNCDGNICHVEDKNSSNITNGVMLCNVCKRWYPIEDGILIMLPDNLIKEDRQKFLSQYGDMFNLDKYNNMTSSSITKQNRADRDSELKKSEMDMRDEQASIYHKFGSEFHDLTEKNHFIRLLSPPYNSLIVELGCGTGRITEEFAGKVDSYIAMDFSVKSLELLRDKIKTDILLVKGDVCRLPVIDEATSYVLSAQVFEHVPGHEEQQEFVKELKRILRAEGQAVLTVYNYSLEKRWQKEFQKKGFHADKIYYECFTSEELLRHFKDNFEVLDLRGINCYLPKVSRVRNHHLRRLIENILSRSFLNSFLGNIWLLSLQK